jgi:thioredoxin 1
MMGHEITVSAGNFQKEVLDSAIPVIVDFWAEWCMPCRMIAPILEKIAEDYQGRLKVAKANADELPDIAAQYGIQSLPTLLLIKGGKVVNQHVGAAPRPVLERLFKEHL